MKRENKSKVLGDHKKEGKKLIPPLMGLGNLRETSYTQIIIPEIIWIAILNKKYGIQRGAELGLELVRSVSEINSSKYFFAFISSYELLTEQDQERIIEELKRKNVLELIQKPLANFLALYPQCPISFLADSSFKKSENALAEIKDVLIDLYDQVGRSATFMMGDVIYFLGALGRLRLVDGSVMQKLPELKDYPNTQISKMIASGIRASMYAFMNDQFYNSKGNWNKYFWNRGIELEPCVI